MPASAVDLCDSAPPGMAPSARGVWLCDPLCFTPWYTAALTRAMMDAGAAVRLICAPFLRERGYFNSLDLHPYPGSLDVSRHLAAWPGGVQRVVRVAEAALNTKALAGRIRASVQRPGLLHLQQLPLLNRGLRLDFKLIAAARARGVPVVHTVHNLLPHDSGERLHSTYGELYAGVDQLVCHSDGTADRLSQEFRIASRKICVIAHGPLFAPRQIPSQSETAEARVRLAVEGEGPLVVWQGVLATYKGLDVLLEAWRVCVAACRAADVAKPLLLMAGTGTRTMERSLRSAAACSSGTIRCDLGYILTNRLPDYYTAADVLVFPYRDITTSGALLTGLSYGKPIIASRLAAFAPYLREGDNARLAEPGNSAALAEALMAPLLDLGRARLAGRTPEPDGPYGRLAAGAARNLDRFCGWDAIAASTLALYERLVPGVTLSRK